MTKLELQEEAAKVLHEIPRPFGTFEKAKYELYEYKNEEATAKPIYFFTTTNRTEEECIDIMKKISSDRYEHHCAVYKIKNGIKEIIYSR